MAKKQHYMTEKERYQLEALLKAEMPVEQIAQQLGFCRKSIYNEIHRGEYLHDDGYRYRKRYSAQKGQIIHDQRQQNKGRDLKIGSDLAYANYLEDKMLREGYSPAAALASARKEGFETSVCVTTLYSYIDKRVFYQLTNRHLWEKPLRRKKAGQPERRHVHEKLPSIEARPESINQREEPGHFEMDLVVSGKEGRGAVLTMIDRVNRTPILEPLPDKRAETVRKALRRIRRRGVRFLSITTDNGPEFLEYDALVKAAGCEVYYCHSYSAWEKGQVENQNRIIRRFYPSGTDFAKVPKKEIRQVQDWIDNYPRKSLGWLSPREFRGLYYDSSSAASSPDASL